MLYVQVRFLSPLNVSSGEDEWTDADLLRDGNGNVFVPGSSLAGAMRAYIRKEKMNPVCSGIQKRKKWSGYRKNECAVYFRPDI